MSDILTGITQEQFTTILLAIVPTVAAAAGFYYLGVRSGKKQATEIITKTTEKMAKVVVDAINANRRIDKVTSGRVALRKDGTVGADLVVVAEQQKTVQADAILVKEGEVSLLKVVAEKDLSHTTDTYIADPEKKD